ncbi:MAG: glutathione transferase [Brachymonas sp.]|nr:glutathione transferase [Brachymonas sp.]
MHLYVDSRYTSPYAMFVYVTLREKNKAYFDITPIDLRKGEQNQGEFAKQSLTQRVPMYEEDGFAITESTAILEYLEEKHDARPAYPLNREDRARARQLQGWFRTDLQALRKERPTTVIFYKQTEKPAPLSAEAQADADQLIAVANTLLAHGGKFLFDERWSILDVELALMLQRLIKGGDPVPENLVTYANFQWQRPSVQWWATQKREPL